MLIEVETRNQIVALSGLTQKQVAFGTTVEGTTLPYIAIAKISAPRIYTHDGNSKLIQSRIQANVYGRTYQEAKQLAQRLYLFDEYSSDKVASVEIGDESEGFDNAINRFSSGLDFMIKHYE